MRLLHHYTQPSDKREEGTAAASMWGSIVKAWRDMCICFILVPDNVINSMTASLQSQLMCFQLHHIYYKQFSSTVHPVIMSTNRQQIYNTNWVRKKWQNYDRMLKGSIVKYKGSTTNLLTHLNWHKGLVEVEVLRGGEMGQNFSLCFLSSSAPSSSARNEKGKMFDHARLDNSSAQSRLIRDTIAHQQIIINQQWSIWKES